MSKILVDTNLLLDDPNILFKLHKEYSGIVLSAVVLKELDKHKVNPDLSFSARAAINSIKEFQKINPDVIEFVVNKQDISSNDDLIIEAAKITGASIATKDISMSIISESKGVKAKLYGNIANGVFNPYTYIKESDLPKPFCFLQKYHSGDYENLVTWLEDSKGVIRGSWFFVFVQDDSGIDISVYANNPLTSTFERIDNNPKYRTISGEFFKLKSRDVYQICAFYALANADNVLITGKWGSGKSLISSAYALSANNKKTFISRPPIGIDPRYNIGFLPGGTEDKLSSWAMGFLSSLYFLFGNTKGQAKEGKSFDFVKAELFKKYFELMDINSIQGLSLMDDFLLIDEVQLCTIDLISACLSRATDESKIIMTGDLVQSYNIKPSNSGLLKLLRALPHKSMAYVDLKFTYRSELLELAEKLQDKTF
jgi:PhoH-like ATPase